MRPQGRSEDQWQQRGQSGFGIPEFVISSLILLIVSASVFSMLNETQRNASYQTEVQSVLQNTRITMEMVERLIRQAGNNPLGAAFEGVTIVSPSEIRLRSDTTGSANGNPDKGDPDGDTADAGEDVTIRYNVAAQSIDLVPDGVGAQSIANYISNFSMEYYDAAGATTNVGANVRRIRALITGATTLAHPQTHQIFSQQLTSDIQLATRQ